MNNKRILWRIMKAFFRHLFVMVGSIALTLTFFLVLPFMQKLSAPPTADTLVRTVKTIELDAPEPPPEPEQKEEPEEKEEPPELEQEMEPLDLQQLELALTPSLNEGLLRGDFSVSLNTVTAKSENINELFSISELDQRPRAVYQPGPHITDEVRSKAPGKVTIIFLVDEEGRVLNPQVQQSTNPVFERPALNAVKQWRFEPGKRNGQPVRFRMRVPITFPEGL